MSSTFSIYRTRQYEFTIADGDTLTLDMRAAGWDRSPVAWTLRPVSGATVSVGFSNADDPSTADDWFEHLDNQSVTSATADVEDVPIAYLRFAASGGAAKLQVITLGKVTAA